MPLHSPGKAFRAALSKENPLQIVGTINANHALLAQRAGYQTIYLSGTSKPICSGLRVAYLVYPDRFREQIHVWIRMSFLTERILRIL